MPGPIPKRSESRRRRNKPENEGGVQLLRAPGARENYEVPSPDPDWHPVAARIYKAAKQSGQARFYEPSDWAVLWWLCDEISAYKMRTRQHGGAMMLQALLSGLNGLVLTEGERRRARIELTREGGESDELSDGDAEVIQWQRALKAAGK